MKNIHTHTRQHSPKEKQGKPKQKGNLNQQHAQSPKFNSFLSYRTPGNTYLLTYLVLRSTPEYYFSKAYPRTSTWYLFFSTFFNMYRSVTSLSYPVSKKAIPTSFCAVHFRHETTASILRGIKLVQTRELNTSTR